MGLSSGGFLFPRLDACGDAEIRDRRVTEEDFLHLLRQMMGIVLQLINVGELIFIDLYLYPHVLRGLSAFSYVLAICFYNYYGEGV